jgi:hypothetical protein
MRVGWGVCPQSHFDDEELVADSDASDIMEDTTSRFVPFLEADMVNRTSFPEFLHGAIQACTAQAGQGAFQQALQAVDPAILQQLNTFQQQNGAPAQQGRGGA